MAALSLQDSKHVVLVMEYASRGSLYSISRRLGGRMAEAQIVEGVLLPLLAALQHLHGMSICHRDIKVCGFGGGPWGGGSGAGTTRAA